MENLNYNSTSQNDPFGFLPDDSILQIALSEPISNITKLCLLSIRFNNVICNNNIFWRQKFIQDLGEPPSGMNITSWKNAYQNYHAIAVFGNNEYGQLAYI